jgi:hypothetical protein
MRVFLLVLCGCHFISGSVAKAAVTITFTQVGPDVVATTSGSIAAGWTNTGGAEISLDGFATSVTFRNSSIRATEGTGTRWTAVTDHWTFAPFSAIIVSGGVFTGDTFGYSSTNNFYTPAGVGLGEAFTPNTTITWAGRNLDTMFENNPPYTETVVFTLDNADTISIVAVPEPATVALLTGLVTTGVVLLRRRRLAA